MSSGIDSYTGFNVDDVESEILFKGTDSFLIDDLYIVNVISTSSNSSDTISSENNENSIDIITSISGEYFDLKTTMIGSKLINISIGTGGLDSVYSRLYAYGGIINDYTEEKLKESV